MMCIIGSSAHAEGWYCLFNPGPGQKARIPGSAHIYINGDDLEERFSDRDIDNMTVLADTVDAVVAASAITSPLSPTGPVSLGGYILVLAKKTGDIRVVGAPDMKAVAISRFGHCRKE
jgi:hypothetical protein